MIPFGSQRASGQDLATHLLNAHDNDRVEIADLRGSIAQDLHGAFAEWEALAHALTRCKKYLYSLSVNPDPEQGTLTRAQYEDYIRRVEERLGLSDQPRAVVFHVKRGKNGRPREHCHVIWSRIDADNEKAVHIAFDREKLMKLTREFARDHHLRLPDGYHRAGDDDLEPHPRRDPLSLHERAQENRTGITKEQRMEEITEAWRRSDSAKAFVRALEERGYILARGRRPWVLVDAYGEINALARLIDDPDIRTKDIRAFLEKDFPQESLPDIDRARLLAAQCRKLREDFERAASGDESPDEERRERLAQLMRMQVKRREVLSMENVRLMAAQAAEGFRLATGQQEEIRSLDRAFREETARIESIREAHRPTGLAAFLGRVTGVSYLIRKIQARQDRRRRWKYLLQRTILERQHKRQREAQEARWQTQRLELVRRFRALDQIERREVRSLDTAILREGRIRAREERDSASWIADPSWQEDLDWSDEDDDDEHDTGINLQAAFDRAAGTGQGDSGDDDDDGGGQSASHRFNHSSGHHRNRRKRRSRH